MPAFQIIEDLAPKGKTALVRVDYNVPMLDGEVSDDTRLQRTLPTIRALQQAGAKIVLLSHFGRPKGQRDDHYSLRPVAKALAHILGEDVAFANDCIGPEAQRAARQLKEGQILMLENTRFHPEEEANDGDFARQIAELGEIYINDAFSCAHRAHATTEGLAHLLPSAAGRLMQEELTALSKALEHPQRPVAAIVGGAKVSTKLDLLGNLVRKVDILVLGGGMANTFMAAKGLNVGKSLYEPDMLDTARAIMETAEKEECNIVLPHDVVVANELKQGMTFRIFDANEVPDDMMILDIGPSSRTRLIETITMCKTIIWNGPLGVFEIPPFDKGTNEVAIHVADLTKRGKILSVAGGGDTLAAMAHAGVTHGISYLSTAGGAFLEWLEGKTLPGVAALSASIVPAKKGHVII
ncbi:MAG: phosphoglycerate kinase [Alphaproteobacteria bacterium]|nr:phosphoglycerate kinase [Alphaproteobacteria bacterium]